MTSRAVHWHEKMFIRPQHFQASHRYFVDLSRRNHNWDLHYNWGLRSIEIDEKALENHRFVVRSLEARLRDGTLVAIPRDGNLLAFDLRRAFEDKEARSFTIYLAVRALNSGRLNVSADRNASFRYYQESTNLDDENTGGNPQTVPMRVLNFQLLVGNQDLQGYEALPIARVERSAQADGGPQLDLTFIPPLLSCDAWGPLANDILRAVVKRMDAKIERLVQQMSTEGITFDRQAPGDALVIKQLQQLNEAISALGMLVAAPGVHPLTAFLELSRLVGQLAIFGATRRPPELPQYNHDDLATCFGAIKRHLDAQLDIVVEPEYKERPFVGAGWRMQVGLEVAWLEPSAQIFIGVQTTLDPMHTVSLLTKAGQLDMKVGSSDRVEDLFRQGNPGLRFVAEQLPPQELPKVAGQVYFRIDQDPKNPEWIAVKRTLSMALRLNENSIVGSIQNQRRLTVKVGGRNVTMQFLLYVLPAKRG